MKEYNVRPDEYDLAAIALLANKLGFECYRNILGGKECLKVSNHWISFEKIDDAKDNNP